MSKNSEDERAETTNNSNREMTADELDQIVGGAFPLFFFFANSSRGTDRVQHTDLTIGKLID